MAMTLGAQERAEQALKCADVVADSETDGLVDPYRLRQLQIVYVADAVQAERERYWIHRTPAAVHGASPCEPQYKTSQCLNRAHWHKFEPLGEEFFAALRARTDLPTLVRLVRELSGALNVIAEEDELVNTSGVAWTPRALKRRQVIARQALAHAERVVKGEG